MPASRQPMSLRLRNLFDRLIGKEVALRGGMATPGVVRVGDTVRRPLKENSAFVHDVLRHLELRGFDRAPRFLGIDEKGRAMLTYISGTVPRQVGGFQKEQWLAAARLLRLFHDATVDCDLKGESEVVCHGDPAPGNYVLRDGMPFALIDFDGARPGKREEDVGYAAWMWLHIGNRKVAPEEQGSNLVDFVAAYDAAATWSPLEAVLQAQTATVARIPNSFKWAFIKAWAQSRLAWTWRNREGIAAGIATRSDVLSCPKVSETPTARCRRRTKTTHLSGGEGRTTPAALPRGGPTHPSLRHRQRNSHTGMFNLRSTSMRTSPASSICLRRIVGALFLRLNSKCAHQVRPPPAEQ